MPRPLPSFLSAPRPSEGATVYNIKRGKVVEYRKKVKASAALKEDDDPGDDLPKPGKAEKVSSAPKTTKKAIAAAVNSDVKPKQSKAVGVAKKDSKAKKSKSKPTQKKQKQKQQQQQNKAPPSRRSTRSSRSTTAAATSSKNKKVEMEVDEDDDAMEEDIEREGKAAKKTSEGVGNNVSDEAEKLFKKLDADGSGQISLEEFREGMKQLKGNSSHESKGEVEIPEDFECPLTMEVMVDPVINENGNTFERDAIEEWYKMHDTDPLSNEHVKAKSLVPNRALAKSIEKFCRKHKIPVPSKPKPSMGGNGETKKTNQKRKREDDEEEEAEDEEVLLPITGKKKTTKKKGSEDSGRSKKKKAKVAGSKASAASSSSSSAGGLSSSSSSSSKKKKKTVAGSAAIWAWKSDLYADDDHDWAWTPYDAKTCAKIEAKYKEDPNQSFELDPTYSIDLQDSWQYRTTETHRRRPIRRRKGDADTEEVEEEQEQEEEVEAEAGDDDEEEEQEEQPRWFWKSDLDLEDDDAAAWTQYPDKESKKIEKKYQEGKSKFKINGRYSVDLDEHIQHQTNDKDKQRSIKRHPAADGWEEDDEEDSGDDDEHQFSEDDDEEYEDDGGDDDDDDEYQEEEEEESD